jgi:hypothetical protein
MWITEEKIGKEEYKAKGNNPSIQTSISNPCEVIQILPYEKAFQTLKNIPAT